LPVGVVQAIQFSIVSSALGLGGDIVSDVGQDPAIVIGSFHPPDGLLGDLQSFNSILQSNLSEYV